MGTTTFPTSADVFRATESTHLELDRVKAGLAAAEACLLAQNTRTVSIPIGSMANVAGTQLTTFADGASTPQPGLELTNSKALSIRWNNHATPLAVMGQVVVPMDADITQPMTLVVLASKVGATDADDTTFTIACFNQVVGTLHDVDTSYGGATSAMVGTSTSKTVQRVTLTLAAADLPACGSAITTTAKPTDGTLTTDDVCMHAMMVEYTPKMA